MTKEIITGQLLDEQYSLTITELCGACQVQIQWIVELVDEGILEPSGLVAEQWRFPGDSLQLARTVRRLQQDLEINIAGAALVLDLLDENTSLRARLSSIDALG